MWEVDPETRSKLHQIQKKEGSGNDRCCDCGAPSPQWASPKFSSFICLSCAGIHRGLGVHISFVRSISMDAFKQNEILRMQHGGNQAWQDFYNANSERGAGGKSFVSSTVRERYESDAGDEWKERLSAEIEDKPFDREAWSRQREIYKAKIAAKTASGPLRDKTNADPISASFSDSDSHLGHNDGLSPPPHSNSRSVSPSQKERNQAYFSNLGATNASRPENLIPSQGGRYTGFGSSGSTNKNNTDTTSATSSDSDQQQQPDPLASLTKSLGWFTTSVTRTAKSVNSTYIQPTAKNIANSDLAAQARTAALQAGTGIQTTARSAGESFNRFVEGQGQGQGQGQEGAENKDFWDHFADPTTNSGTSGRTTTATTTAAAAAAAAAEGGLDNNNNNSSSSIGTTAVKKKG